jgi:hypothetical protein
LTKNTETQTHFLEFEADVNTWKLGPPGVQAARPPRCGVCDAPGVDVDGKVVLHGHGLRERTLLGPLDADGEPTVWDLLLRRYACQRCKAVLTVGPRGLLPRRRYCARVIALALWLWAVHQLTDAAVRQRVSPIADEGLSRPERWTTLRRWGRAVREGRLWSSASIDPSWSLRDCASRAAHLMWSRGSPDASTDESRVFRGAALAR